MPITDRNLSDGTVLTATYKKTAHAATVYVHAGKFRVVTEDGKEHDSVSAAAASITGGAVNGWKFWTPSGQAPASVAPRATKKDRIVGMAELRSLGGEPEPVELTLPEGWIMIPADLSVTMRPGYVRPAFQQAMFDNICMDCKGPLRSAEGGFCSTAYPVRAICAACKVIDLNDVDHEVPLPSGKKKSRKMR